MTQLTKTLEVYLIETRLLNFSDAAIQQLITHKGWQQLDTVERVKSIYTYVRDEIRFGYNVADDIPASQVLADGYGQCNTKATLLMALLRATGVPCRLHGFTIDKALQKGAISGIFYALAPQSIIHAWAEVYVEGSWYNLEGVILDKRYLTQLKALNRNCTGTFCGFGAYVDDFQNHQVDWNLNDTYIQVKGINQDFGLFDSPDDFYRKHRQQLNPVKELIFRNFARHMMNRNVARIRNAR